MTKSYKGYNLVVVSAFGENMPALMHLATPKNEWVRVYVIEVACWGMVRQDGIITEHDYEMSSAFKHLVDGEMFLKHC